MTPCDESAIKQRDIILKRVLEIIRRQLAGYAGVVVMGDTDLTAIGVDSLVLVMLIMELEDSFGVTFPSDTLESDTFRTPLAITNAVASARHGNSQA